MFFSVLFLWPRRTHRKGWKCFKTGIHWVRRVFSLWRRRVFLLCTQFGFYLFFFLHLNLFWPLPFKFFPTSQHDRTNILFWIQCLGGNFPCICAFNFPTLEATCPICFSKLWILGLDCLIEVGSHNISWDDLSIQDCTCWKRDHIYAGAVRWILHQLHELVQCNLLALLGTYLRYVLVRSICYKLSPVVHCQRTHKRSKIINFIFKVKNTYLIYSFVCEVSTGAKLFRVGCHVRDQLACSLGCLIHQCPSTCSINDTTVSRHQSFIEILNE